MIVIRSVILFALSPESMSHLQIEKHLVLCQDNEIVGICRRTKRSAVPAIARHLPERRLAWSGLPQNQVLTRHWVRNTSGQACVQQSRPRRILPNPAPCTEFAMSGTPSTEDVLRTVMGERIESCPREIRSVRRLPRWTQVRTKTRIRFAGRHGQELGKSPYT